MKRGDVVVVAAKGAYTGKPRPALVVQSDFFNPTHQSVTVCPITSDCVDAPLFRIPLPPGERTGLRTISQIMVDKGGRRPAFSGRRRDRAVQSRRVAGRGRGAAPLAWAW